jgi:hypothetical protein
VEALEFQPDLKTPQVESFQGYWLSCDTKLAFVSVEFELKWLFLQGEQVQVHLTGTSDLTRSLHIGQLPEHLIDGPVQLFEPDDQFSGLYVSCHLPTMLASLGNAACGVLDGLPGERRQRRRSRRVDIAGELLMDSLDNLDELTIWTWHAKRFLLG